MKFLLPMFKKLGLSKNESRVYIILLSIEEARASEIAKLSGVPRSKIYEITESLHEKGFIEIVPEKITKFKAVPFEKAFSYFIENWENNIKSIKNTKNSIDTYLKNIISREITGSSESGFFTVLKSKKVIHKKIEEMLFNANENVFFMMSAVDTKRFFNELKNSSRKKIKIQILSPIAADNLQFVKRLCAFSEFRHYAHDLAVRIISIDNKEILIYQTEIPTALYSRDPQFVSFINQLSNTTWRISTRSGAKIAEIEEGKPIERTRIIYYDEIKNRCNHVDDTAQKELDIIIESCFWRATPCPLNICQDLKKYIKLKEHGIKIRIITQMNDTNMEIIKKWSEVAEIRHNYFESVNCLKIADSSEFVLVNNCSTRDIRKGDSSGIFSNSESEIMFLKYYFERIWDESLPAAARISEIETGKPAELVKIIKGYDKIMDATKEATITSKNEICNISSEETLERAKKFGLFDEDKKRAAAGVHIRYILPVNKQNMHLAAEAAKFAEVRHSDFIPVKFRLIKDEKCFARYGSDDVSQVCIMSTVPDYLDHMAKSFEKLWSQAMSLEERIFQIENRKEKVSTVISDNGFEKAVQHVSAAKKEVLISTTSKGVAKLMKIYPFADLKSRSVEVKLTAPITNENLSHIKKLLKYAQVKHVNDEIFRATIIDGNECFVVLKDSGGKTEGFIYSTDANFLRTTESFFNNSWNVGINAKERIEQLVKLG